MIKRMRGQGMTNNKTKTTARMCYYMKTHTKSKTKASGADQLFSDIGKSSKEGNSALHA